IMVASKRPSRRASCPPVKRGDCTRRSRGAQAAVASTPMEGRPSRLAVETSLAALVLLAVFLCGYSAVSSTNFGGSDEWWIRSLGDRLVVSVPYANRPLNLVWSLPGSLLSRGFVGYHVVNGVYLWLCGVLLYVLLRRLGSDAAL